MITCRMMHLLNRCRERGYTLEQVRPCIVSEDGDTVTVDETHASYPHPRAVPLCGPGCHLKRLLAGWPFRIVATATCKCNARAAEMDTWGCDLCEQRMDEIVGWLREEAGSRRLPFSATAARLLIRRAIANARRESVPAG